MKSRETFHQTLAMLIVGSNELGIAIGYGWLGPVLKILQDPTGEFSFTLEQCSWIASLEHTGKMLGAILAAIFLDTIGRKFLLSTSATIFLLMWLMILVSKSVAVIYLVRIVYGIALGIHDSTSFVYLSENSSPFIRGIFGTISLSLYYLGVVIGLIVATYLSYRETAFVNFAIELVAIISIFWIIEPVQYLLMNGRRNQAEENFIWLKGAQDLNEVIDEFEIIKKNTSIEKNKKSSLTETFTSPANYKSLLTILTTNSLAGMIGYHEVISFAPTFFPSTELLTPNEFTILLCMVQYLVALFSSFIIERFERKSILLSSFSLIALAHATTAALFFLQNTIGRIPYFSWLVFISIAFFVSAFTIADTTIILIRGELFPLSIRSIGSSMCIIGYSVTSFLVTKIFLFVSRRYGIYFNFVIYSIFSAISVLIVRFICILPDTRNKSLVEIQQYFENQDKTLFDEEEKNKSFIKK